MGLCPITHSRILIDGGFTLLQIHHLGPWLPHHPDRKSQVQFPHTCSILQHKRTNPHLNARKYTVTRTWAHGYLMSNKCHGHNSQLASEYCAKPQTWGLKLVYMSLSKVHKSLWDPEKQLLKSIRAVATWSQSCDSSNLGFRVQKEHTALQETTNVLLTSIVDFRDIPEMTWFISNLQHDALSFAGYLGLCGTAFISDLSCLCRQMILCC